MTAFGALDGQKYLNLETYRKNGRGVRTPVWFAAASAAAPQAVAPILYVYTTDGSGKAKRIRNLSAVKIAPCDARGNVTGSWIGANAEIVGGEEARTGMRLLDRKYWPWKQLIGVFSMFSGRHQRVVLAIRAASP